MIRPSRTSSATQHFMSCRTPYLYPAEQLCAAAQRALADGTIGDGVVIARRAA